MNYNTSRLISTPGGVYLFLNSSGDITLISTPTAVGSSCELIVLVRDRNMTKSFNASWSNQYKGELKSSRYEAEQSALDRCMRANWGKRGECVIDSCNMEDLVVKRGSCPKR